MTGTETQTIETETGTETGTGTGAETQYDPDLDFQESETDEVLESLDPDKVERYLDACRARQRPGRAIVAGLGGVLAASALWLALSAVTGRPHDWAVLVVGLVGGLVVRFAGRGVDTSFAVLGAGVALLGAVTGHLLTGVWLAAFADRTRGFLEALRELSPSLPADVLLARLSPGAITLLLLATAAGYWLSARRITRREIVANCLTDAAERRMREAA